MVFAAAKQSKYFPLTPIILLNVPATAHETPSRQGWKRVFETGAKKCRKSDAKGKLNICRVFCGEGWAPTRAPTRALSRAPTHRQFFRSDSSCCHCVSSLVGSYHPSNAVKMGMEIIQNWNSPQQQIVVEDILVRFLQLRLFFFYGTLVQQFTSFSR